MTTERVNKLMASLVAALTKRVGTLERQVRKLKRGGDLIMEPREPKEPTPPPGR